MPSYYWFKLYDEILDDPKMGKMSDRLFRRCIQLMAFANRKNEEGKLPAVCDMAWTLRCNEHELMSELEQLADLAYGVVHYDGVFWYVTNFAKRQERMSDLDRQHRKREREKDLKYYGNEPVTSRDTDKIRIDIDKNREELESEPEKPVAAAAFAVFAKTYESEIGALTGMIGEELEELAGQYSAEWFREAVREAVSHNARNLKYIKVVLQSWKTKGFKAKKGKDSASERDYLKGEYADIINH